MNWASLMSVIWIFTFSAVDIISATRCLACKGIIQPWHCNVVRTCPSDHMCGVTGYKDINDHVHYDVDCIPNQDCSAARSGNYSSKSRMTVRSGNQVTCSECCHGDICNFHGCGSSGYPANRGPVCFSCHESTTPDDCADLDFCKVGKRCAVLKKEIFGETVYSSKCVDEYECDILAFGKKRQSRQMPCKCCDSDFCNYDCEIRNSNVQTSTTAPSPPVSSHTWSVNTLTTSSATQPIKVTTASHQSHVGTCTDAFPECQLRKSDCQNNTVPQRHAWMVTYCRKTCNLCTGPGPTAQPLTQSPSAHPKTTTSVTSALVTSTDACVDTLDNCDQYHHMCDDNGAYYEYAKSHCRKTCNFCTGQTTPTVPTTTSDTCIDTTDNCHEYGDQLCEDATYHEIAEAYCQRYCHLC